MNLKAIDYFSDFATLLLIITYQQAAKSNLPINFL